VALRAWKVTNVRPSSVNSDRPIFAPLFGRLNHIVPCTFRISGVIMVRWRLFPSLTQMHGCHTAAVHLLVVYICHIGRASGCVSHTRVCVHAHMQVHDWHAAAAPMLYWEAYNQSGGLWRPRLVMTIHNLDNSGECRQDEFSYTGLAGEPFAHVSVFVCVRNSVCRI